jgi:predicted ribosome quality control (RQC) complex YloA/Tae2 family protein
MAQELEQVIPEIVSTDSKGYKSVDYSKLTVVLAEAIKEQQGQILQLQQQSLLIKKLEEEIEALKRKVN